LPVLIAFTGVCKPFVEAIDSVGNKNTVIVDLSADYRFTPDWTYGLPELITRGAIARATRIANPGCYATAAQIGIAPLLPHLGGQPTVFGVSGYSGAGTKPSPKNNVENLTNNIIPYSLTDHIHEREISAQLGTEVAFIPHVASWFQGIHHTINIPLSAPLTSRDIRNLYQERFAGEPLVRITGEPPSVKDISGTHGVEVGGFGVHSSGNRVVSHPPSSPRGVSQPFLMRPSQIMIADARGLGDQRNDRQPTQRRSDTGTAKHEFSARIWRVRGDTTQGTRERRAAEFLIGYYSRFCLG
jgi:N-acetyl-gamma-glutamyl-phosphate reductase common form